MRRLARAVLLIFAGLGALMTLVTVVPLTRWWAYALAGDWPAPEGEVLVVLASDAPNGGIIGQGSYWRAVYAVRTWRAGRFERMLVAGGEGSSDTIREFAVMQGVPAAAIEVERISASTHENALFTAERLKALAGRKVLLTSDYHMYRALRVFRRLGLELTPQPFPEAIKHANSWWHRWDVFVALVVETGKIAGYRIRGWI